VRAAASCCRGRRAWLLIRCDPSPPPLSLQSQQLASDDDGESGEEVSSGDEASVGGDDSDASVMDEAEHGGGVASRSGGGKPRWARGSGRGATGWWVMCDGGARLDHCSDAVAAPPVPL